MIFSDEHLMIRNTVRHRLWDEKTQDMRKDIKEMIRKYEVHGAPFPWEWVYAMAELGLTGINIPEEFGGQGADNLSGVIAMIEMSKVWSGGALVLGVGNSLVGYPLAKFGNDSQKNAWLPRLASGKILGSFGLTEPGHGSDAGSINETFAEKITGGWQVSGQKQFITNVPIAEFIILFARTNRQESGYKGITAFLPHLLKPTPPSLTIPPPDHKLGNHAAHMGKIFFDNYHLFESTLFGEYEKGFKIAMATLAHGRNWIAAQAIGVMEHALLLAMRQANDRIAFGEPLIKHSTIYTSITELALAIDVSKILLFYSAKLEDEGKEFYPYASLAKLYSSESACRLIQEVQTIYGGSGYVMEADIASLVADSVVFRIYEGASSVQKDIILKAWFEDKLKLPAYIEHLELERYKRDIQKEMNGTNFLKLHDQHSPSKIAGTLPLVTAWYLLKHEFAKEYPKAFLNYQDPGLLRGLIFDKLREEWPNRNRAKTKYLWKDAIDHLKKK